MTMKMVIFFMGFLRVLGAVFYLIKPSVGYI
ncbi:hypothetical protein BSG1_14934 [Bacillus sp. SG-1]|nr:hypothetical protein BSG1_14934 [Bacillus sp. SG-1]